MVQDQLVEYVSSQIKLGISRDAIKSALVGVGWAPLDVEDTLQNAPGVPEGGQEGFEALWLAYDFRKRRAEARAAYAKPNPDAATQARLLTAAVAWRKAWEAQDKPNAPRKYLYSWLAEECFEEDAPGKPLASPTRKAKAATKSKLLKADNDNQHSSQSGWERVQIVASKIVPLEDGGRKLMMLMSG